jgi:PPE family protein/putative oligomerization/nucleic acid binding protein
VFVDPEIGAAGIAIDSTAGFTALPYDIGGYYVGVHTDDIVSGWAGVQSWPGNAPVPPSPFPVITNLGTSSASAGMGAANTVGGLSVPPAWTAATPAVRPVAMALPATSLGAAAEASTGGAGSVFSQLALASMAGRAMAGTGGAGRRERVGATAESGASHNLQTGPITSIAAELRELASLHDSGILTEEEFDEQKRRLLPH